MKRRSPKVEFVAEVYVETSFLMGLAKAQDPIADELIRQEPAGVRFLIPGVCHMEALASLNTQHLENLDRSASSRTLDVTFRPRRGP